MREEIVAAALELKSGVIAQLPPPFGHPDILHGISYQQFEPRILFDRQGFVTSTGRFVDRKEGLAIAKAANQIVKKHGSNRELYSEDLYVNERVELYNKRKAIQTPEEEGLPNVIFWKKHGLLGGPSEDT
jgi:hypothetical protein